MRKRILSIILCTVLLLALVPSAFAAKEIFMSIITSVQVTIDAPKAGEHPDFSVDYISNRYNISKVIWRDIDEDVQLHADDVFKAGHQYEVVIFAYANEGLTFKYDGTWFGKINNETVDYSIDDDKETCSVFTSFPRLDPNQISSVNLTFSAKVGDDIEESVNSMFFDDMPFVLDHYSCYNRTNAVSQNEGKFLSGKIYAITAYILPKDGFAFSVSPALTAAVNDESAEANNVIGKPDMRAIVFKAGPLEGKDPTVIDSVNVTIEPAKTYEFHSFNATASGGCEVESVTWKETDKSGTQILSALESGDYFMGGTTYAAFIIVNAPEGCTFSDLTTVKVNGVTCKKNSVGNTWGAVSETQISVKAVFNTDPTDEPAPIKEQGVSLQTQPVERMELPESGTASENHISIEIDGVPTEIQMYKLTDENGGDTNFVRLRDIAALLDGTHAQFDVDYIESKQMVNCTPRTQYVHKNGTEGTIPFTGYQHFVTILEDTLINGYPQPLTCFRIYDKDGGGHTYYKLRDLGNVLGFNVGYSHERGIYIESDNIYSPAD
jgi:hypothetical protein